MNRFRRLAEAVRSIDAPAAEGRVIELRRGRAKVAGLASPIGAVVLIECAGGRRVKSEVTGIEGAHCHLTLAESPLAIGPGARAIYLGTAETVAAIRSAAGRRAG